MISISVDDRLRLRERALRRALGGGQIVDAARAAGRARVPGTSLTGRTLLESRAIRSRFGRSLRRARQRRSLGAVGPRPTQATAAQPPDESRDGPRRAMAALGALALVIALLFIARPADVVVEAGGGGGAPVVARPAIVVQSRGRTIDMPPSVAVAPPSAEPSPEPTAEPVAVVSAAPPAPGLVGRGTGGTGAGNGGFGSGSGSSSGSGRGVATPTAVPTPTPTPAPTPAPPVGQNAVLTIFVVDPAGRPVPDVCLVIGTGTCTGTKPHTDANGAWSTTVPIATPTLVFDMTFVKPGYVTYNRGFTLKQGQTTSYTVRLYWG